MIQQFVLCHNIIDTWLYYAKFEEKVAEIERARYAPGPRARPADRPNPRTSATSVGAWVWSEIPSPPPAPPPVMMSPGERSSLGHKLLCSIQMPEILPPTVSKGRGGGAVHVHKALPPPPPFRRPEMPERARTIFRNIGIL